MILTSNGKFKLVEILIAFYIRDSRVKVGVLAKTGPKFLPILKPPFECPNITNGNAIIYLYQTLRYLMSADQSKGRRSSIPAFGDGAFVIAPHSFGNGRTLNTDEH